MKLTVKLKILMLLSASFAFVFSSCGEVNTASTSNQTGEETGGSGTDSGDEGGGIDNPDDTGGSGDEGGSGGGSGDAGDSEESGEESGEGEGSGDSGDSGDETYSLADITASDSPLGGESSGVMLQGFDWSSNSVSRNNYTTDWYTVISNNASEIKDTFEYVWYPPVSDSNSDNGYLPRQLNLLTSKYGDETSLKASINAIKPAKAIADIVINHRVGTTSWGDFTNPDFDTVKNSTYYAICSDDEGFSTSGSDMYGVSAKGNADTGEGYSSGRDLDHTNWYSVQNPIVTWMNTVLKGAGFAGWRYDYVKGFGGKYVGYYNAMTDAAFSVGEHWPTEGFNASNPSAWEETLSSWVNSTGEEVPDRNTAPVRSRVFDFVLKGLMNHVFGSNGSGITNKNYDYLANASCIYKAYPAYAVTFVDNHDTGSTQALWYLDPEDVACAYAFILTHPGYPCVAWQHYFTAEESSDTTVSGNASQYTGDSTVPGTSMTYHDFIEALVALRKESGITELSAVNVYSETSSSRYMAEITGSNKAVLVNIGQTMDISGWAISWEEELSGTNFQIWSRDISN